MPYRVAFDICGSRYETWASTLKRYPNTLLGSAESLKPYYDQKRGVYAIRRNQDAFDAILFFYQSGGILARPAFVSESEFLIELEFFGIIKKRPEKEEVRPPATAWKRVCWMVLEYPKKSMGGIILANVCFILILASIFVFCLETVFVDVHAITDKDRHPSVWFALESCFIVWFTMEFITRCMVYPNTIAFLFSPAGLIDMLSILPYYLSWILFTLSEFGLHLHVITSIARLLRLCQIVRAIKLARHSSGLQVLIKSLAAAKDQIVSLLLLFMLTLTLCSAAMFELEMHGNEEQFQSIPHTVWYSIISMVTVGYGDMVPKSLPGKIGGAVTIFLGVIIIFNLFVPIYLTYFTVYYRKQEKAKKLREKYGPQKRSLKTKTNLCRRSERMARGLPTLFTLAVNSESPETVTRARKLTVTVEMKTMHVLSCAADTTSSSQNYNVLPFLPVRPEVESSISRPEQEEEEPDMDWMIYEWKVRSNDENAEEDGNNADRCLIEDKNQ